MRWTPLLNARIDYPFILSTPTHLYHRLRPIYIIDPEPFILSTPTHLYHRPRPIYIIDPDPFISSTPTHLYHRPRPIYIIDPDPPMLLPFDPDLFWRRTPEFKPEFHTLTLNSNPNLCNTLLTRFVPRI